MLNTYRKLTDVSGERNERGRTPAIYSPCPPIDNDSHATIATPPATHHLRPPLPSLRGSVSVGTHSGSSRASSVTNITRPSSQHKVSKKPSVSKSVRPQFYCPDCGKVIKNGFLAHFRTHVPYLLDEHVGENDAIGCGYCLANDLLLDQGKVFRGIKDFVQHVKDAHASVQHRLHWDFNASFNHILSAQQVFRRKINLMTEQNSRKSAAQGNNTFLALSWTLSPHTRQLLNELQAVSVVLDDNPASIDDGTIHGLMERVYEAAAQKWQPYSTVLASDPIMPQRIISKAISQPPILQKSPQISSQDAVSFAEMGQDFFDTPTPKYAKGIQSPNVPSPAPQTSRLSRHVQHVPQQASSQDVEMVDASSYQTHATGHYTTPLIAFDGQAPFPLATLPPSQLHQEDSFEDFLHREYGLDENDLFKASMDSS